MDEDESATMLDASEYEKIFRSIEKLKPKIGRDNTPLGGTADRMWWTFEEFKRAADHGIDTVDLDQIVRTIYDVGYVLSGVVRALDILREKIEELENKVK